MKIHNVDHVEFYVGDAQQTAFYFRTAFGFRLCGQAGPETGQPDSRSLLLRQGDIRILLTSGLTAGHPASAYVARHGDGVANIALLVDDARAAYAEAVARGAGAVAPPAEYAAGDDRVVTATVAGFGDVSHRFVERHGSAEAFLPGVMVPADGDTGDEEQLLTEIDHVAICLPSGELDGTVRHYREVFGFDQIFEELIEVGEQAMDSKVVQSPSGTVTFTLIQPVPGRKPGQIDGFLARHGGAGVQHLAFLAADIIDAVKTLEMRGVRFLLTPDSYYDMLQARLGETEVKIHELRETNVLVDRDHWGELFQIFTRSMHVRNTYFSEIIDRHGARTFGSNNIRALYQAVARDEVTV